jgi:LCP family protein required for cell wall assembly
MERWVKVLMWMILLGLLALVVVGMAVWDQDPVREVAVVVTPTVSGGIVMPPRSPTARPTTPPTVTATPSPTATATPTPTPTPSATFTPTPTPTPTASPTPASIQLPSGTLPVLNVTPIVTSTLPQPTPMPHIQQPEGTINVLLLGSDRAPGETAARTDVLMLVSIFPDVPSVSMMSIPRDYYAWIPTWGLDKINTAYLRARKTGYPGGGPALVKATVEYNFGVPVHYYALVDFRSYRSIVDAVGGVDLVVECPFHDTYPDPEVESGQSDIDLEPGVHHLDGKHALWYVRSRWNTSDFDRHRRQQQVLRAIMDRALSENLLARVPDLWGVYKEDVETDMALPELLYLAPIAARLDARDIKSRFIRGERLLTAQTMPVRGYVLIPHYDAVYEFVEEAVQPPVTSRAAQRAYRVEVYNGTGNAEWGQVAAYRLRLEGFVVPSVQDVAWTPRTSIVDFTTTSKGSPIYRLRYLYERQPGDVTQQPTEGSPVDFRVILGSDYNPCHGTGTARWRATPTPSPTPAP